MQSQIQPQFFFHCGNCGSAKLTYSDSKLHECPDCGWVYYVNPVAAVVGLLRLEGCLLFVRRAQDPYAGKLDLPGGFIDFGETAETALRRELKEELDLEPGEMRYFSSAPNIYEYRGVSYHTLDLGFEGPLAEEPKRYDSREIQGLEWQIPDKVKPDELAFDSIRQIVKEYCRISSGGNDFGDINSGRRR